MLFIHLSVDGQLGCSHFLAVANNAVLNFYVHVFMRTYVFIFLEFVGMKLLGLI